MADHCPEGSAQSPELKTMIIRRKCLRRRKEKNKNFRACKSALIHAMQVEV